jgi:hypothetical protein
MSLLRFAFVATSATGTFALHSRSGAGHHGTFSRPWFRHAHHLFGDAVRLILKRIVDLSDNEFPL